MPKQSPSRFFNNLSYVLSFIVIILLGTTKADLFDGVREIINQKGFSSFKASPEYNRLTKLFYLEVGEKANTSQAPLHKDLIPERKNCDADSNVRNDFQNRSSEESSSVQSTLSDNSNQKAYKELESVIRELHSEISSLKKNLSNIAMQVPTSEFFIESDIWDGKSFPVGTSYHQVRRPSFVTHTSGDIPKSCKEILDKGFNVSGVYEIQPNKFTKPLLVLCDMETRGGGWTHIQKRFDGSVDFFLGWREYKFGFGDLEGEFWLGLENIYKMTGVEIVELLVEIVDRDGISAYAHYKGFSIGSEVEGYKLNIVKGFSGDAGDSLIYHLGCKFTTKDFDQDTHKNNCAIMYSGAWWYKDCHHSNLNGKYINADLPSQYQYNGLHWRNFKNHEYCHAKSRMMIRPAKP